MIRRKLIATLKVRNLTIQTLFISGAHDPDIARKVGTHAPRAAIAPQHMIALPCRLCLPPGLNYTSRFRGMFWRQTVKAHVCGRERT